MDVLEKEEIEYKKLIVLSKEKTPVIIEGNIDKLQEIIDREQPIIDTIHQLEHKREEAINDIAIVLNKDVETLKLKKVIQLLKGQPDEQHKLAVIHDKLSATVKTMSAINENNKMLLEHSLEMVDFEINLYQSMKKAPETANYGKDAYSRGELLINLSDFDAKQ